MRKIACLFLLLFVVTIGLAACNQQPETVKEKPSVSEPKDVQEPDNEVVEEEEEEEENAPPKNQVYQNDVFKEVVVSETADEITVTGKAQVFEGVFQYALYDGEKLLKESNYQTEGAPAWGDFKIKFEKNLITSDTIKFELFVYSAKDGSKINTLEIPIPRP